MSTSAVQFISSLHGRQRRQERNIDQVDFLDAKQNGEWIRQSNGNYKTTWRDVVYILRPDRMTEVTSYPVPLPLECVPLDAAESRKCDEMARRIRDGEALITSHTVIVVDQSGSMRKSDVPGHRTRSRCVFYNIAMEVISAPLLANLVSFTDIVTVIQMRDDAEVIVDAEPVSWRLFNRFVEFAERADQDFEDRNKSKSRRRHRQPRARGGGNFIPALNLASDILTRTVRRYGPNIALFTFFLSDGRPSDHNTLRVSQWDQDAFILDAVEDLIRKLPRAALEKLIFGAFGFASRASHDFVLLEDAADQFTHHGALRGVFQHGVDSRALRKALLQLSGLLTTTISRLSSLVQHHPQQQQHRSRDRGRGGGGGGGSGRGRRGARIRTDLVPAARIQSAAVADIGTATTDDFSDFNVMRPVQRYVLATKKTPRAKIEYGYYEKVPLLYACLLYTSPSPRDRG